jgi:hypothetical protein
MVFLVISPCSHMKIFEIYNHKDFSCYEIGQLLSCSSVTPSTVHYAKPRAEEPKLNCLQWSRSRNYELRLWLHLRLLSNYYKLEEIL